MGSTGGRSAWPSQVLTGVRLAENYFDFSCNVICLSAAKEFCTVLKLARAERAAGRLGCGLGIIEEPRKENKPDMKYMGVEVL